MKTRVIIYIVGGECPYCDGRWWLLTVKGMKKIVCMLAGVTGNAELRLCG